MSLFNDSPLGGLPHLRNVQSKRSSSWDRTGDNIDFLVIPAGETALLADIQGAGCINHIWCTHWNPQPDYLCRVVLRLSTAYWYQLEPHKAYQTLLPVSERLPRPED